MTQRKDEFIFGDRVAPLRDQRSCHYVVRRSLAVARQARSRAHIKLRSFPFIDAIIAHIYINIQECKQLKEARKLT